MFRHLWLVAFLGLSVEPILAQEPYGPRLSPYLHGLNQYGIPLNVSPYLHLSRGGNPALNYYLGVVPEVARRRLEREFVRELDSIYGPPQRPLTQRVLTEEELQRLPEQPELPGRDQPARFLTPGTYPPGFMNYGPYYNLGQKR